VYELADRLSGELDIESVARIIVAEASRLPAGGAGFLLVLDGADVLNPVGGPGADATPLTPAAMDQGIVGAVARSLIAEEVNDVGADPRATLNERQFASMIAAPIVARGRTVGVLGAGTREPANYQAADLKLLAAIAAMAGPALAQTRSRVASREGSSVRAG
jgi:GAF domain-containing protein